MTADTNNVCSILLRNELPEKRYPEKLPVNLTTTDFPPFIMVGWETGGGKGGGEVEFEMGGLGGIGSNGAMGGGNAE